MDKGLLYVPPDAVKWRRPFIIGVLAGVVLVPLPSAAGSTPKRLILIVAGQSNATGAHSYAIGPTGINYLAAPYATVADAGDLIAWRQSFLTDGDQATPVPLDTPQIRIGPPTAQIFGPEIGLAREVYAATGRPVTIVKVAFGETALEHQWVPGGIFWTAMTRFVKTTIASDAAKGQTDVIGGFYWIQGETDAQNATWAADYQANLTRFVNQLRVQLPITSTTPIVLAKTWNAAYRTGSDKVRAADDYVAAHTSHVYTVDTKDLPRYADHLHLLDTSELILGAEMAKVAMP